MPEGDTLFRAARTLHRALAGRTVRRFDSVFPRLTATDRNAPLEGRVIERVDARGKHLLIWFSGGLVLRTHMRMHGSWHIYRPGEAWQRPRHEMRIVIGTDDFDAVAFSVPVAELTRSADDLPALQHLGPDVLATDFDAAEAIRRIEANADVDIADALLDQHAIAGLGNIFKSEVLFVCRVNPFTNVRDLSRQTIEKIVAMAVRLMRANTTDTAGGGIVTFNGLRRRTGRSDVGASLWVYGRAGKPCRRCGTLISRKRQGTNARSTYFCAHCQP